MNNSFELVDEYHSYLEKKIIYCQNCYSSERGLFICHECGVERTGGRSMKQHVMWHQKHPNEDYQTCNICQQCNKVCTDYNALKFHWDVLGAT